METIAKRTPGFRGADLANMLNEAVILTGRQGKTWLVRVNTMVSLREEIRLWIRITIYLFIWLVVSVVGQLRQMSFGDINVSISLFSNLQ
ncbi:uncharacterized protein [Physcomitrium patens]|uniref:AAA ATPase AAA+ lid domain-containing protein n=1 Tax=Physcomitrium patens TaxID=3218 RepID=A0A7I4DZ01_PHYPA